MKVKYIDTTDEESAARGAEILRNTWHNVEIWELEPGVWTVSYWNRIERTDDDNTDRQGL